MLTPGQKYKIGKQEADHGVNARNTGIYHKKASLQKFKKIAVKRASADGGYADSGEEICEEAKN